MDQSPLFSREGIRATPVAGARRFAGARQVGMPVREYCDVCRAPIEPEHRHMLATAMHKTTCVCEACALRLQQLLPEHVNTEVPV